MAFQGTDREAVEMAAHLLRRDGLFLGSSAAMNCVGAVKARPCPAAQSPMISPCKQAMRACIHAY